MCDKLDKLKELTDSMSNQMEFVDQLTAAINTSHEGIAILDKEGKYIYLNSAHEEMFGYSKGELVGKSWTQLYRQEDIDYFITNVFPIIDKVGKWSGKYVGYAKDGSPVNEEVYLTALPDGGLICTCRVDICNTCDLKQQKDV